MLVSYVYCLAHQHLATTTNTRLGLDWKWSKCFVFFYNFALFLLTLVTTIQWHVYFKID